MNPNIRTDALGNIMMPDLEGDTIPFPIIPGFKCELVDNSTFVPSFMTTTDILNANKLFSTYDNPREVIHRHKGMSRKHRRILRRESKRRGRELRMVIIPIKKGR